ncbi:MAG TPA: universal stress protein [Desulfobulbus sp.]|nr:universal stress protein [Desulfobulbus sp.]
MALHTPRMLGEIETIALATDGTKFGAGAEREALFLCKTWKARLLILHVITVDTELATSAHAESATLHREIRQYIRRLEQEAAAEGIACRAVIEGSYMPEKTIIELAQKNRADMIVTGRHGRSSLMKLLAGSVASKIIGLGFPKVLVVPRNARINVERLLLATDGSEFAEQATEEVVNLGIHCPFLQQIFTVAVAAREPELKQARQTVEKACRRLREAQIAARCLPVAEVGRTAEIITGTARKHDVGMIVMGGHGRGLSRLLMGHVTEKVISQAHCAVLVVER